VGTPGAPNAYHRPIDAHAPTGTSTQHSDAVVNRLMSAFAWCLVINAVLGVPIALAVAWSSIAGVARIVVTLTSVVLIVWRIVWLRSLLRRHEASLVGYFVSAALALTAAMIHPIFVAVLLAEYIHSFVTTDKRHVTVWLGAGHSVLVIVALLRWAVFDDAWLLLGVGMVPVVGASISAVLISELRRLYRQRDELLVSLADSQRELARVEHDAGVLAERQRISRDLHDTIAQDLVGVVRWIERAQYAPADDSDAVTAALDRATQSARAALAETRSIVAAQPPPALSGRGLDAALHDVIRRNADLAGEAAVQLHVRGDAYELPLTVTTALLRIAHEGVSNAQRHGRASSVDVSLTYADDQVVLVIADNGIGLPSAAHSPSGHGLHWMRGRIDALQGTLHIESEGQRGTRLVATIPR
jgi:signal transduction histidine kinase